jgi:hypothetical protein
MYLRRFGETMITMNVTSFSNVTEETITLNGMIEETGVTGEVTLVTSHDTNNAIRMTIGMVYNNPDVALPYSKSGTMLAPCSGVVYSDSKPATGMGGINISAHLDGSIFIMDIGDMAFESTSDMGAWYITQTELKIKLDKEKGWELQQALNKKFPYERFSRLNIGGYKYITS